MWRSAAIWFCNSRDWWFWCLCIEGMRWMWMLRGQKMFWRTSVYCIWLRILLIGQFSMFGLYRWIELFGIPPWCSYVYRYLLIIRLILTQASTWKQDCLYVPCEKYLFKKVVTVVLSCLVETTGRIFRIWEKLTLTDFTSGWTVFLFWIYVLP